jgi:hypothetical protein
MTIFLFLKHKIMSNNEIRNWNWRTKLKKNNFFTKESRIKIKNQNNKNWSWNINNKEINL